MRLLVFGGGLEANVVCQQSPRAGPRRVAPGRVSAMPVVAIASFSTRQKEAIAEIRAETGRRPLRVARDRGRTLIEQFFSRYWFGRGRHAVTARLVGCSGSSGTCWPDRSAA